jgi:hypothetical protein
MNTIKAENNPMTSQADGVLQIGTVIEFRENEFKEAARRWNMLIIPAIEALGKEYEALEMGEFDQDTFNELLRGLSDAEKKYKAYLEADLKKIKLGRIVTLESLIGEVPKRMAGLRAAKENFNKVFNRAKYSRVPGIPDLPIEANQVKIMNGKPILDEEMLKARFTITIETETQLKIWGAWCNVRDSWNKAVELITENGFDIERFNVMSDKYVKNGFVSELPDGKIELDPLSLEMVNY